MTDADKVKITDKESAAKTAFSDKPREAQAQINSREDTAKNITDKPQSKNG